MYKTMAYVVAEISRSTTVPQKQVRAVLQALTGVVQNELQTEGGGVTLPGLGTFKSVKKGDRYAVNPRTQAPTYVVGYLQPVFKSGVTLKAVINGRTGEEPDNTGSES